MAFSLINHTYTYGADNLATSAVNTTGANLIVIAIAKSMGAALTVRDSKGNTWTLIASADEYYLTVALYYCVNPTVGPGHIFYGDGTSIYADIFVQAWSGANSSPLDVETTNVTAGTSSSLATGSVLPSVDNELVVAALATGSGPYFTYSIDSGFSISDQNDAVLNVSYGGGLASLVQTTKGAVNPTWSWGSNTHSAVAIASFKPGASAPALPFMFQPFAI